MDINIWTVKTKVIIALVSAYTLLHVLEKKKETYSLNTSEADYLKWNRHETGSPEGYHGLWM